MRDKKTILLFVIIVLSFLSAQVQATPFIPAEDHHQLFEFNVGSFSYHYVYGTNTEGTGEYGTFTAHYDDITFFIVDQENFDKYEDGQAYTRYEVHQNVVTDDYEFRYPHTDTWYRVFDNKDSLWAKDVTFNLYTDLTPPTVTINLDTGATYGGIKEITATASEITFLVWKLSLQYYSGSSWIAVKTEYYTESISYNWDTKDFDNDDIRWRVVAEDTVNNEAIKEVIVTVYNYVAPTTTTTTTSATTSTTTSTTTTSPGGAPLDTPTDFTSLLLLIGVIGIVLSAGVYASKRSKSGEVAIPSINPDAKVLVICPFCGSKNEQGITICSKCNAEL